MGGLVSVAALAAFAAQGAPASVYTYLDQQDRSVCQHHSDGSARDEDWITYRCAGFAGVEVWLTFNDSAYMNLSFGGRDGDVTGYLLAERDPRWPLEWRHRGGRPYAVIARMVRPDMEGDLSDTVTTLMVYGLRPSGSCILGDTSSNEEARRLADRYGHTGQCPR